MISDVLPLVKMAKSFTGFAKKLGITNKSLDRIHQATDDVLQQSDVLTLPDRFNDAFARKGWVATGSMSADTMQTAIELYEAGKNHRQKTKSLPGFKKTRSICLRLSAPRDSTRRATGGINFEKR